MSSAPPPLFADDIARDARWLAQALDLSTASIRFVAMSRADYRSASFLDDRMFEQQHDVREMEIAPVVAAMADRPEHARWIFHLGHVGSTLIARLLGEIDGILSIREPRLLRDLLALSPAQREALLPTVRALYSRHFDGDQAPIVKATSFVAELAGELLPKNGYALMLGATPRNYIGSILAGENSSRELHALAGTRETLLSRRAGPLSPPRHLADLAAIGWACGATALESAAEARPDAHIAWCDFDRFLDDVGSGLADIAAGLGIDADPETFANLADSPLLGRYSKAMEYEYSADLRAELIADAGGHYAADIDEAMAMLEALAKSSPLLERALKRSEEA